MVIGIVLLIIAIVINIWGIVFIFSKFERNWRELFQFPIEYWGDFERIIIHFTFIALLVIVFLFSIF